jgi:hypothetical protein
LAAAPLPSSPLPGLPVAPPGNRAPASPYDRDRAPEGDTPPLPIPTPSPAPTAMPTARPTPNPTPRATPRPAPAPTPRPTPAPKPAPRPSGGLNDAGVLTVSGLPYEVNAGEEFGLKATVRNTGRNGWLSKGPNPVRLLIRWHDARTGTRTRWAIRWLRADVPPGGTSTVNFTVPAPPKPGDYILRFSLVRLSGSSYEPPPWSQRAGTLYPGEFGVATTTMPVR